MDPVLVTGSLSGPSQLLVNDQGQPISSQNSPESGKRSVASPYPSLRGNDRMVTSGRAPIYLGAAAIPRIPASPAPAMGDRTWAAEPDFASAGDSRLSEDDLVFERELGKLTQSLSKEPAFASVCDSGFTEDDIGLNREMAKCRDRLAEVLQQERTAIVQAGPETTVVLQPEKDSVAVAPLERTITGFSSVKGSPALSSTYAGSSSPASTRAASRTVSAVEDTPDMFPDLHEAPASTLQPVLGLSLSHQFGDPDAMPPVSAVSMQNGFSSVSARKSNLQRERTDAYTQSERVAVSARH